MASWTAQYDPGVPESLHPYPAGTLVDFVRESAAQAPDAPALFFKGTQLSNAELHRLSDRLAASLVRDGVARGDRVAFLLPNSPQFLIAELAVWKAGATVLPLNPMYTGSELIEPLHSAGVKLVISLTPFYGRVKEIQALTSVKRVIATNIKEFLPSHLKLLFTLFKEKKAGHRITLEAGDAWFQDLLRGPSSADVLPPPPQPDEVAVLLMSGGTTGVPKAVVGLHRSMVQAGVQLKTWLQPPGMPRRKQDITVLALPLFHVYACVGIQTHAITGRLPMALVPNPRDIDDLLKCIATVRPTFFSAVPALFIALLNHQKVKARAVDFSSIRACFSGAAPLMAATKMQFEELTGGQIVEGYSLTEAMMACAANPLNGLNKIGSVGIPLPDVDIRIVDTESGDAFLRQGETGEIVIRAPQLMAGYFNNAEETARVLRTHGEGGPWLHTGDLGYLDQDSYLFIVDRQKDLIKTSGFQVWPREIEEVLALHPGVQEVGVAGVPDPAKGEVVKAWIVKRAGADATIEDLRAFCRQKLATYKTPAHVEFRDSLPKTMTGKVLRRALVAEHLNQSSTPRP